ncbi:MAG: DUF934 domain-containing protein [Sphingomonadaceae bacterium]|uniref:DUF934 domain-containing protein n=1 Tax=Thermaurantiacus sp. TaxID=2820283 RepID=UPI00298EF3B3|nr:DUF934 domain-containing protein [Thermaurantiacus sp.]MCS6987752.1 DUF934 domain-containing protein [Sphingomonadaceae bacterium]MDW8415028.1 DUF934 domain-containing protein [Thermaurantiacus sp.]
MVEILALDGRARTAAPDAWVEPEDDVRARPQLLDCAVVAVRFPRFRDGRGYSSGRLLRELGFGGDLRAAGDVTVDQLWFLKRAGFSSVAPDRPIHEESARRALERYPFAYQRGQDGSPAAFELRAASAQRGPAGR